VTVNAFSGLSSDPPLVLLCLRAEAGSTPAFTSAERFAVSILRPEHEELAERFASGRPDRFILGGFDPAPSGIQVVRNALAVLECARANVLEGGDHVILVGEVERAEAHDGAALVYFGSEFGPLAPIER
jgi:flavin reductase ActVB